MQDRQIELLVGEVAHERHVALRQDMNTLARRRLAMKRAAERGDHPRIRRRRGEVENVHARDERTDEFDAARPLGLGRKRIGKIARQRRAGMHEDAHAGREQVQNVARIRTALHNCLWTAHLLVRTEAPRCCAPGGARSSAR